MPLVGLYSHYIGMNSSYNTHSVYVTAQSCMLVRGTILHRSSLAAFQTWPFHRCPCRFAIFQQLQDWNAGITALGRKQKWQAALATAEGMERRCLAIQMGFCTDLWSAKLPCLHLLLLHFLDSKHSSARCQIPWDEFTFCALIAACSSASLPGAWGVQL